ncbi:cache domain-containing protein [Methanoculleus taiwanensis]|uniref:cache domain-containing protein n=1 Tax=Methanoculleus taiwanensis TaxID=1550565 RepID=UPI000FFEB9FC|nr:cache domain-containing protein [Methanoculleus taiwanensis]
MKLFTAFTVFLVMLLCLTAAGCTNATEEAPPVNGTGTASAEELVAFVEQAYAFAGEHGKDAAIEAFNDPNGEFVRGDLYIFAYDYAGTTLVLPHEPEIVGTNRIDLRDANGVPFIREMIGVAGNGSGFFRYHYPNPEAGFAIEPKLSYVMRVDETWWLGAGIYGQEAEAASPQVDADRHAKAQIVRFVEDAAAYARTNGREAALAAFMDRNGPFVMQEVYIYALDFNGTCLALPYQPDLVGTSMIDLSDTYGVNVTRVEIDLAREGGGFIFYHYPNPARNFTVEPKMSYVQQVDETWWIGAGIYLSDLTENSLATRNGMRALLTGIEDGVDASLAAVDANVSEAARHFGAAGMTGEGTAGVLEYLVASSPAAVDAVTFGPDGRILAVAPEEYRESIGVDISEQAHIVRVLKEGEPALSGVFTTVEGFAAATIARPAASPSGEILGGVSLPFRPDLLLADVIVPAVNGTGTVVTVIQTDGRVLYDPDPAEIGKMTFADPIYADYPDLLTVARRVAAEPEGAGGYEFLATGSTEPVRKEIVWGTAALHGTEWRIVVTKEAAS